MYRKTSFFKLIFIIGISSVFVSCGPRNTENKATATDSLNTGTAAISAEIEKNGSDPELYYRRATMYYEEKYLDRALDDIEQAITLNTNNPLFHFTKGRILYAMNKTIEASKAYEEALRIKPDYTEAMMKLAELYYVVKEHEKSLNLLNRVIAADPSRAVAYYYKGMNYKETPDTPRAISNFQLAYENDKNYYNAVMQLGLIYAAQHNKVAMEYYMAGARIDPKSPEPYYNGGVFLQEKKEYKGAIQMYRKALERDPKNDKIYYNVGYMNFEMKQYEAALKEWNIAVQLNTDNLPAYYMRGLVYEHQGKKEDARINYEYALELDPGYKLAEEGLARVSK